MYTIVVYDVEQRRVGKICRYLRRYLNWVQNSAFEGELTEHQIEEMAAGLRRIINREQDSVYIYQIPERKWCTRRVVGVEKTTLDTIL
ncbi:CRISPR-associated endonuclease Cas2 [Thermogutta sp.]|jgi:CRISPR-associated protein Cas2|uniref:CRISPR-associated endonuclease Cas2 n=1 Tax=Thermogutta sp. TaxID=1962930 RepID=UPI0032209151